MDIKTIHQEYFQKSKLFLYPILGIKKGHSISLIETYTGWKDKFLPEDNKLLCLYYLRKDPEFINFEKTKLLNNPYFMDFYEVESEQGVYIFDLREYTNDCINFHKGKYSKFSSKLKTQVINFQPKNTVNYAYVNSFVHPEKYFGIYKEILGVPMEVIKATGELCDPPNIEKETLLVKIKSLDIKVIST